MANGLRMNKLKILVIGLIAISLIVSGCISEPSKNTSKPFKNTTNEQSSLTTPVSKAPKQLIIEAGKVEQFTYNGHNIEVNYTSAYPIQIINVKFDGFQRTFQRNLTENPNGIFWKEQNFSFVLKPVVWEIRDSQKIPIYEKTWNTNEIYFEIIKGGK